MSKILRMRIGGVFTIVSPEGWKTTGRLFNSPHTGLGFAMKDNKGQDCHLLLSSAINLGWTIEVQDNDK